MIQFEVFRRATLGRARWECMAGLQQVIVRAPCASPVVSNMIARRRPMKAWGSQT